MALGRRHDRLVGHGAGAGDHDAVRRVFPVEIGADAGLVEAPDRLGPPEDRPADRLVREGGLHEGVVDHVVGGVLDGGVFLQDDALLPGELARVEHRIGQDVADHVEGETGILAEHPGGVARALGRGRGVDLAADILDLLRDLLGRARARVPLNAMCSMRWDRPGLVGALVARAGPDPDARLPTRGIGSVTTVTPLSSRVVRRDGEAAWVWRNAQAARASSRTRRCSRPT